MIKEFFENQKQIRKNLRLYKSKRSDSAKRAESEFIDHGIATIPCNVSGMDDIISHYSVPGCETLNGEFVDYLKSIVALIPDQYPIVLNFVGKKFTEQEQENIRNTIEYDLAYDLGFAEKESRHTLKMMLFFIVGTVLTCFMIASFDWWPSFSMSLLEIFYWFFAYTFVEYVFIEGRDIRKQRIRSARLACIKVVFSEKYDGRDYSEEEAKKILDGLHGDK